MNRGDVIRVVATALLAMVAAPLVERWARRRAGEWAGPCAAAGRGLFPLLEAGCRPRGNPGGRYSAPAHVPGEL